MPTSSPHDGVDPYGSAHDLPSMVEMKQQLRALRWLSVVLAPKQRTELRKLERELSSMLDRVDAFYWVLGERNWIFTDHLPMSEVEALVAEEDGPARAETRLIKLIADRVRSESWHIGLQAHEALRARRSQLERARQHYINEEWSSSTLQLIAVMDGFVNDLEPSTRKGLHARTVAEISSWDSLSNHHSGIASVLPVFQKTFKKRVDGEVFELHRHGIVHGSIVNFDNQVVATKAWNMLSAVADLAKAREREIPDSSGQPTWGDVWKGLMDLAERKRARESFKPYELTSDDAGFGNHPLVEAATSFLDAWSRCQWALVAQFMPPTVFRSAEGTGARAKRAKDEYGSRPIGEFELTSLRVDTAGGASVVGRASLGDYVGPIRMRWMLMDADEEHAVVEGDDTRWKLGVYPAHCFILNEAA